jgi:arylsulfatase A-like enzyme
MLGAYGNEWTWTRTFDRLASRGIVFDQHFTATTQANAAHDAWHAGDTDIIHRLNKAGVCTVRLRLEAEPTLPAGWVIDELLPADARPESLRDIRRCAYDTMKQIPANAPALFWIELDPLVAPWRPTNEWLEFYFAGDDDDEPIEPWFDHVPSVIADDATVERLQTTYAATLSSVDQALTRLLAGCRARGFGKNGLTILTADLGDPLGENGLVGRQTNQIGEGLVHLPLFMRCPGNQWAGRRVSQLTQPADVSATLLHYFGAESIGPGIDLRQLVEHGTKGREFVTISGNGETAIRTAEHLLIAPNPANVETARLYLKPEDRWEFNDLAKKQEGEVERLLSML